MQKMNYPKGLIRYTTENLLNGKASSIIRPRSVAYSMLLLLLIGGVAWGIASRSLVEVDILRDRNVLYREVAEGVENVFTARILNKDQRPHTYAIDIQGLESPEILLDAQQLVVPSGGVSDATLTVRAKVDFSGSREIVIRIAAEDDDSISSETLAKFIAPQ